MKTRLLLTTAVGVVFATAAFAQSPKEPSTSPSPQTQTPQKAPDRSSGRTPSSSQAQTTPSTSSQSGGTSAPAQAQTNAPSPSNNQAQQTPATGSSSNQAQQAPASSNTTAQQPPQNTTAQQPSQNTTAQQPSQSTTAQQPAQSTNPPSNTAQSSSTNVNASVNINDQQRTRVTQSISRLNVQPLTNVNFSLSVGTAVPRDVRLQTLPADVVEIVPQYRGYSFFVVRDEIVIVEPSTYQIVTVLPRSGGSTAAAPARSQSKAAFTDKDRDAVRKHVKTRTERTERQATGSTAQTTGSSARMVIRRGERLPEAVEVDEFPETVYRDAPALREYRYIHRENRTYLVDPGERMVIEEID
ncbi:DUF1236 domain-containing protein [Bradyrhizobium sp. AUGA SZCCT0169]|uniref:DUF1236 domain-containing protein n=1 Tax=Bradyrhizobium sp. AUGA SZCCT0169 TaxID=2807663 RepID=UPI001BAB9648|nr:DUF1236 domain-containing protein [Bradyrhizobium sp. AUGA SZCCT0169]MBR1251518.1 DUF1236 domain-containing protein [Bradyrhizobium sp. AUGA SZCCT0169]